MTANAFVFFNEFSAKSLKGIVIVVLCKTSRGRILAKDGLSNSNEHPGIYANLIGRNVG
jgi:hypothetical protein